MLKYYIIFIGETKAILVSEISCSKKRWGNRNSSTAYLHTSYCLSLRPQRSIIYVIINHRNHTTRVLSGPFFQLFFGFLFFGGETTFEEFSSFLELLTPDGYRSKLWVISDENSRPATPERGKAGEKGRRERPEGKTGGKGRRESSEGKSGGKSRREKPEGKTGRNINII